MATMLTVQIDEEAVKQICRDRIDSLIREVDGEYVMWDSSELKKRTCMSWNTIQENFFHDHRFPKYKIGGKWYFPVAETKSFLMVWLSEQRTKN